MAQSQPLSPNEIRDRALSFARDWEGERREKAEAQTFWNEFFNVFGISRRRVAAFEEYVKPVKARLEQDGLFNKSGRAAGSGFIDLFWKGVLIAEHKSAGKDLDSAYKQALNYFDGLKERDLPRYVIVSDFARIRLYDLEQDDQHEFPLIDLHKNIGLFGFISGYTTQRIQEQDPVNIKAAEKMGRLHDQLKESGYAGHALEVLLVRLLFCLFAEDTTIFNQKDQFRDWIENCTREDGSDLGAQLSSLFQVLNTKEDQRQKNLDERFSVFPYVNGKLFEETLPVAAFNSGMREALLDCCRLDWGRISPAIFGALFQSVMDDKARRNLGAHYTSEKNILKVVKSLFLDDLRAEYEKSKSNRNRLFELHKKLAGLSFFDPACGCGNFLVIAYRELRHLELDILRAMLRFEQEGGQRLADVTQFINIDVNQFYGIEIEEFPAQIAQVALWLMDHQMNMRVSEEFGFYYRRLPLSHAATIRCGNALRIDWNEVIPVERVDYIFGNPPFVGKKEQSKGQKGDTESIFGQIRGSGVLDYVTAWYMKTVRFLQGDLQIQDMLSGLGGTAPKDRVRIAFVSTNSITQGEQVAVLWGWLLSQGVKIHFAHRTFQWSNEARGMAAVHCVIIGFALFDIPNKRIFDYPDIKGNPHEVVATNINPYLVDAPTVLLEKRVNPICIGVPEINKGSEATDFGYLILSQEEKDALLINEPSVAKWVRRIIGGEELINNIPRWCLWLIGISPEELRRLPKVLERVELVRQARLVSGKARTREWASYPALFSENRQPITDYLAIPKVSSERRLYIPIAYVSKDWIASGSLLVMPNAQPYHFAILSSVMHMAWMRNTCGRMKSDYQYSVSIVYNNFPWPQDVNDKQKAAVEKAAQAVLDARKQFPAASLADLYDPVAMPPVLRGAHTMLDKTVDSAYGKKGFNSDAERVAFLFDLYQKYTSLLPAAEKPKRARKRKTL